VRVQDPKGLPLVSPLPRLLSERVSPLPPSLSPLVPSSQPSRVRGLGFRDLSLWFRL
jgi:hypothetical protein